MTWIVSKFIKGRTYSQLKVCLQGRNYADFVVAAFKAIEGIDFSMPNTFNNGLVSELMELVLFKSIQIQLLSLSLVSLSNSVTIRKLHLVLSQNNTKLCGQIVLILK